MTTNTSLRLPKPPKILTVFSLVMINVVAVDSLRTLSFGAKFGTTLIFYYLVCAVIYFIPVGLVTAELATAWPKLGGVYVWVKEAYGPKFGFLVIWLQWVYNIIWYPTILAVVASIAAYLIAPELVQSRYYIFAVVVGLFWLSTWVNLYGMEASSLLSSLGSIFGTIMPMLAIIGLGLWWFCFADLNNYKNIEWHWLPEIKGINDIALISTILFGLIGLEMSAVHASEVRNPKRDYPIALLLSSIVILFTLVSSSLVVALVVPADELNIVLGVMQAFSYFFNQLGLPILIPIFGVFIIVGALGAVSTWIIGPTKGLLAVAQDDYLPSMFAKTNKHGAPKNILIVQAIVVTTLSAFYVLFPGIEEAYLVLTELTAILALIMYVLMFASAIRLRYKHPKVPRPFKIPFGNYGMWVVAMFGLTTSAGAVLLGFVPPSQVYITSAFQYQIYLIIGCIVLCLPAVAVHKLHSRSKRKAIINS